VGEEKGNGVEEDRGEGKGNSDEGSNDHDDDEHPGYPSSFSDIYPDFTMTLLYEEELGSSPRCVAARHTRMGTNDLQSARKHVRQNVFLATDVHGTGDLILCILMPNISPTTSSDATVDSNDEPAILRRFLLHVDKDHRSAHDSVRIASVTPLVDLPCTSATQIQSIPIPLAPFSVTEGGCRRSSRLHSADVNTMANDVLVVRKVNKDTIGSNSHWRLGFDPSCPL
jgi:hypothetical protein